MRLENVAHVPGLSHHLFSLTRVADAGNTYTGSAEGIQINMKSGKKMFAPSRGQLNGLYASRVSPPKRDELAHAVIAPGAPQSPQIVDINDFHCAHAHMHEDLLRMTAKQLGVQLRGELLPCQGCSEAKGLRKGVKPFTHNRGDKPVGRLFVDLTGPKAILSRGGKKYMMIVKRRFFAVDPGVFPPK